MDWPTVELRQLHSFAVLAEELHFTRAAARLNVAQPALSQQVKALERALRFRLFDRTSRKVELTAAGAVFLGQARALLSDLERAVQSGRHAAAGKSGTIVIGYVATAMLSGLPALVRAFRAKHSGVSVVLRELSAGLQMDSLCEGKLDVAIVNGEARADGITVVELRRDPLVAVLPIAHPAARRRRVSVAALADSPFVMFPREQAPLVHDAIMSLCRDNGIEPRIEQEAQSWHMVAALVATGLGVSIAPSSISRFRVAGLRYVPIRPSVPLPLVLSWRSADDRALVKLFVEMAKAVSSA